MEEKFTVVETFLEGIRIGAEAQKKEQEQAPKWFSTLFYTGILVLLFLLILWGVKQVF